MRVLAIASGWDWPEDSSTLGVLGKLAGLSAAWDFRQNRERHFIERTPAEVNGTVIPDALIADAARALGFVEPAPPAAREFSHLVILAGQARACADRANYAAQLRQAGLRAGTVVALGAHRRLDETEIDQAREAGFGPAADEAEVVLAATRRAFSLGAPQAVEESWPHPDPQRPGEFHAASARYLWPSAEVVIAPSDLPHARRAKTGDQLRYWADLASLGSEHDILIVTTQLYVPYQHLVASRVLGLERGCAVRSCGVDARSRRPAGTFAGREYLQELRAALRAALALLKHAREGSADPDRGY